MALSRTSSIALIELILVALFSFALGLYLTNQLKVLVIALQKVASGELDYKISVKGKDEVAQVATAFNTMTGVLDETIRQERLTVHNLSSSMPSWRNGFLSH